MRSVWDESNNLITFAEYHLDGVTPEAVKNYFDNWATEILQVNPIILKAAVLEKTEGFEIVRYDSKVPWPMDTRVFFCLRSVRTINPGSEYMMLMTSKGVEKFIQKYFSDPKETKGHVVGTVHIVCWLVKAVKNASGAVTGIDITYMFSVNPNGSIPKAMTEG